MIKLVAIGNRFMRDDGVAIKVAEAMEHKLKKYNIEIILGETDCQSCFYAVENEDFVLILDAFYQGLEAGTIHLFPLEEILSQPSGSSMQHDMSLIELMKLHKTNMKGYLIGIEIAELGFSETLSPILQEKFQQLCLEVENIIQKVIGEEIHYA